MSGYNTFSILLDMSVTLALTSCLARGNKKHFLTCNIKQRQLSVTLHWLIFGIISTFMYVQFYASQKIVSSRSDNYITSALYGRWTLWSIVIRQCRAVSSNI